MAAQLCLGTVQFGLCYGIHNTLGRQPTETEVFGVLDAALDAGVRMFDTASAYGTSEELLGYYELAARGGNIVSKLCPAMDGERRYDVLHELRQSLDRLAVPCLYGYLLHRAEDMDNSAVMMGLAEAKARGWTKKIGVSIYATEDAMRAAEDPRIDIIQVPYNVLDQRLDQCGFFACAEKNGKEVFARSSFLQGLLLMSPADAEAKVAGSGVYVERFQAMAAEDGFLPREAAMLYTLCHAGISYVVFGVDTSSQLNENAGLLSRCHTFSATYQKLYGAFRDIDVNILEPQRWKVCF